MADETQTWNLTAGQWEALRARAAANVDALEDGAFVRAVPNEESGQTDLHFWATALNRPADWRYPFIEAVPGTKQLGAFLGRAWHEVPTGFVQFEVIVYAAAQALRADYESGVDDLDYVTYEQAVERAVRGTPADAAWLVREFARLAGLTL